MIASITNFFTAELLGIFDGLKGFFEVIFNTKYNFCSMKKNTDKSLFVKEKKLSKQKKVYKNEKLNNATLQSYKLNHYRLFLFFLTKISKFDFQKQQNISHIQEIYTINVREFSVEFNVDISTCFKLLKDATKIFIDSNIFVERINSKDIHLINLCSEALYDDSGGNLTIRLTEQILPYLKQEAKRYTLYSIEDLRDFKSLYTIRLFELVQGFKYSGWLLVKVDQLRKIFNVGDKLKKYANFKQRTFFKATQEINKHHKNLKLYFQEIYNGKKVESIKFLFKPIPKEIGSSSVIDLEEIPNLIQVPKLRNLTAFEVLQNQKLKELQKEKKLWKKGRFCPR